MALADAFGLARATVLSTACQQCPELRPSWVKMASKRSDAAKRVGATKNWCGDRCEHGSPCLLDEGHGGGHETEHGCKFYDEGPSAA